MASGLFEMHFRFRCYPTPQPALHRFDPKTGIDESWTMPA